MTKSLNHNTFVFSVCYRMTTLNLCICVAEKTEEYRTGVTSCANTWAQAPR